MAETMERDAGQRTEGSAVRPVWLKWFLRAAMILLALWMISPMLTSSYVEAYVARLQSMAILNHSGQIGLDDQAYPINTELLYVTRVGMVWLMQAGMWVFHSTSLWVLRVITIASLVLLAASSIVFARRWAKVPAWGVLACVVLTPGILEPSFFIADHLVSAALTCLALALVNERITFWRWFGIGAIVACAMLVRLDAVLIVPAVVAVLWLANRAYRKMGAAIAFAVGGAAVVFAISYKVAGVSLVQSYEVGRFFSVLNNNPAIYQTGLAKTRELIFFGFFGLISLPLIAAGAWENFKEKGRAWSVVMTLLPVLFYAVVIPHANEIRDFCIMGSPFVLLHAGTGLRLLVANIEGQGRRSWVGVASIAFFALVLFAPPYISMRDGPRVLIGRAYSPMFWRQWQGRTLGMIDQIHDLVDEVKPGESMLVISSQFEPDRYLHLRLLQEGFRIERVSGEASCQSIETFSRDGRTVVSVRTENPYGMFHLSSNYLESLQIVDSLQCLGGRSFEQRYFFSIGQPEEPYWPGLSGRDVEIPTRFPLRILHKASYGFFGESPLSLEDLNRLKSLAASSVAAHTPESQAVVPDEPSFRRSVGHHYWTP